MTMAAVMLPVPKGTAQNCEVSICLIEQGLRCLRKKVACAFTYCSKDRSAQN